MSSCVILLAALCMIGATSQARAQTAAGEGRATLSGAVFDVNEWMIAGAAVTLTNLDTKEAHAARSDGEGRFLFAGLTPGFYDLQLEANGFKMHRRDRVYLQPGDHPHFQLTLEGFVHICTEPVPPFAPLATIASPVATSLSAKYSTPPSPKNRQASPQRKTRKR